MIQMGIDTQMTREHGVKVGQRAGGMREMWAGRLHLCATSLCLPACTEAWCCCAPRLHLLSCSALKCALH